MKKKVKVFPDLQESLATAMAYETGQSVDLRVTEIPSKPKPLKPREIRDIAKATKYGASTSLDREEKPKSTPGLKLGIPVRRPAHRRPTSRCQGALKLAPWRPRGVKKKGQARSSPPYTLVEMPGEADV
jgi:hypothetical protein